jgi:hypothetical protein
VTEETSTVHRPRATVNRKRANLAPRTRRRRASTGEPAWESEHTRVTFYAPLDLLAEVETSMAQTGRSKTQVIVDALREHLAGEDEQP